MLHVGPGGPTPQQFSPVSHAGIKVVTEATQLEAFEQVVVAVADGASYSLTLPSVAAARGRFYTIVGDIVTVHAVTVEDQNDSAGWADLTLDTDGDGAMLYSDGRRWWVVSNAIA